MDTAFLKQKSGQLMNTEKSIGYEEGAWSG